MKKSCFLFTIFFTIICTTGCHHHDDVVSLFSLKNYDQNLTHWLRPNDENYDKPVINHETQRHLKAFYKHYIGTASPWNEEYINRVLKEAKSNGIKLTERDLLYSFSNADKSEKEIGYGENFHPYSQKWTDAIAENINFSALENLHYNANNRAIAVDNLYARALPTDDPFFYSYKIAGQGYPFDNLQISALWVGTPVYILGETRDHEWSLVLSPDYIGWVKSLGLARASNSFIKTWESTALKNLAAITHTKTSIVDTNGIYRFTAYVGSVFPATTNSAPLKVMIPISDRQHHAVINYAKIAKENATLIPLASTPHNFSIIMHTLIGRPYGWGNAYFYNDCSSELKNLFTPFGVWLPRHSSEQVYAGKFIDLSAKTTKERLKYLLNNGKGLTTIIYIPGHVMLFIGNYPNPNDAKQALMPMTYQDKWGMRPQLNTRRAVIGKSILFPLLEHYPEDSSLMSQAAEDIFQISELEVTPNYLEKLEIIDLKALMSPN